MNNVSIAIQNDEDRRKIVGLINAKKYATEMLLIIYNIYINYIYSRWGT